MITNRKRAGRTTTTPDLSRQDELRQLLQDRRREIVAALHDRIKGVRAEHSTLLTAGGLDEEEASEADVQGDIELALIEMKAETLSRVDEALVRLDEGLYGRCDSCGEDIAPARLRALPFAVRCRDCEEEAEAERVRSRTVEERGSWLRGFQDPSESAVRTSGR